MAADGYLNFDTKIDTDGFEGGIKSIDSSVAKLTGGMKKLAGVVTAAFSAAAIIKFGKDSLEAAADVKAAASQMSQTFGEFEGEASAAISRVADNADILDTRLNGVATSIYAFAKTSGMDSKTALSMMEDALTVAADSAAYYDRSLEDVSHTLQSFLKGNYENDAALGLSATETTRNAKAMELYGKKFADLSESQKQLALLDMVKDANRLSGAMGQAAREADGWANVTGNLREAWRQLLGVVGQPILKLAVPVVQQMTAALTRMTETANAAWQALSRVFGWQDTQADAINAAVAAQDDLTAAVQATEDAQEGTLASFDDIEILASSAAESMQQTGAGGTVEAMPESTVESIANVIDTTQIDLFETRIREFLTWIDETMVPTLREAFKLPEDAFAMPEEGIVIPEDAVKVPTIRLTFSDIKNDLARLSEPISRWAQNDVPALLSSVGRAFKTVLGGVLETFSMVFDTIWRSVLMPFATTFSATILPIFTQLGTYVVSLFTSVFTVVKTIFTAIWQDGVKPALDIIMKIWSDAWEVIQQKWDQYGAPIFEQLQTVVRNVGEFLEKTWNNLLKPIWDSFMETVQRLWDNHLKPLWDNIVDFFAILIENGAIIINDFIAPVVSALVDWLYPGFVAAFDYILGYTEIFIAGIADSINGIITIFKGVVEFITGVFTNDWEKVWNGIVKIFKGIWDTLAGIIKIPINAVIDIINRAIEGIVTGLNSVISALNRISVTIPDWVPGLGGKHFGINIPSVKAYRIPMLATGAVIPPNREFLAVLGDQKQGTNIETPLATMIEAFKAALSEGGYGGDTTVILQVNEREFGRAVVKYGGQEEHRIGVKITA